MSNGKLILALDVEPEEAKKYINDLAPHIEIFKIGGRLFTALGPQVVRWARDAGGKVFLDLKFHDIPATVAGSVRYAVRMGVWGLTVHASGGFDMMKEAQAAARDEAQKLKVSKPIIFGVTVLTSFSKGDLFSVGVKASPRVQVQRLAALAKKAGLDAIVASGEEIAAVRKITGKKMLIGVPGIRPAEGRKKDDQKRIMTPEKAVALGADYLIVGRPILEASDKFKVVEQIKRVLS